MTTLTRNFFRKLSNLETVARAIFRKINSSKFDLSLTLIQTCIAKGYGPRGWLAYGANMCRDGLYKKITLFRQLDSGAQKFPEEFSPRLPYHYEFPGRH